VRFMKIFMIFGYYWITEWFEAISQFVILHSTSNYYFTSTETVEGEADLMKGYYFAHIKHAGSLAMGSFIISVIKIF